MVELYNCALWDKTRVLAQDHGFEMSIQCPLKSVCNGEYCGFLEPSKINSDKITKFYEKLEKHHSMQKLTELREELKNSRR
jgi:hypothetical protein